MVERTQSHPWLVKQVGGLTQEPHEQLERDRARAGAEGMLSEETRKGLVGIRNYWKSRLTKSKGNEFGAFQSQEEIFHKKGTADDLLCWYLK